MNHFFIDICIVPAFLKIFKKIYPPENRRVIHSHIIIFLFQLLQAFNYGAVHL